MQISDELLIAGADDAIHADDAGLALPLSTIGKRGPVRAASAQPAADAQPRAIRQPQWPREFCCPEQFTPREREVLSLLSDGMPNKRIACSLNVSVDTVKWHLKNLYGKLQVADRYDAAIQARRLGLSAVGDAGR